MPQQEERPDEDPPPAREPHVPRPPSREDVERISEQQALITDEWGGEGPQAPERAPPADEAPGRP